MYRPGREWWNLEKWIERVITAWNDADWSGDRWYDDEAGVDPRLVLGSDPLVFGGPGGLIPLLGSDRGAVPPALRARLHAAFHDAYARRTPGIGLAPDALAALHAVAQAGRTQFVLSMHPHDALSALIDRFALRPHLARVDGQQGADAGYKRDHLTAHLRALDRSPDNALLIGDSVDDARAAKAVGVRCVYASGLHAPDTLRAEGVPVVHTLEDALATALPPAS
ncbi:HAD family hydrolase [Streptomyces sp. NPDC003691]